LRLCSAAEDTEPMQWSAAELKMNVAAAPFVTAGYEECLFEQTARLAQSMRAHARTHARTQ
jgi:hypothetical protein